jgi:hypothetical protein
MLKKQTNKKIAEKIKTSEFVKVIRCGMGEFGQ